MLAAAIVLALCVLASTSQGGMTSGPAFDRSLCAHLTEVDPAARCRSTESQAVLVPYTLMPGGASDGVGKIMPSQVNAKHSDLTAEQLPAIPVMNSTNRVSAVSLPESNVFAVNAPAVAEAAAASVAQHHTHHDTPLMQAAASSNAARRELQQGSVMRPQRLTLTHSSQSGSAGICEVDRSFAWKRAQHFCFPAFALPPLLL